MNPIRINRAALSAAIWEQFVVSPSALDHELLKSLEGLRAQADYNTGSVGLLDLMDLHSIVQHFQPRVVAEVGTFIGRSTTTMATAMPKGGVIYTCDFSNAITLPQLATDVLAQQFQKKSSTEMFEELISRKVKVDLFYIDGRLTQKDLRLVWELAHQNTVIVLDDFEGVEKGVANAMGLLTQGHVLVYPRKGGKTAMILPGGLLMFTAQ